MAESEKNKGLIGTWLGLDIQSKLISVMLVGLVVAVGFLGYFYGQLKALQGGGAQVAGAQNAGAGQGVADPGVPPQPTEVSEEVWGELLADAAAYKGAEDASVTLVEFTDYQCPFCKRHFDETDKQIQANYVESGKIRYIVRDLPLPFHANAHAASQAARCAGDQGKYFEMHDTLFENQEEWSVGSPEEAFSGYAGDLGLNVATFDSCLSSEKYKQAVDDDLDLATKAGASGTPTFVINGKLIVGAQPYSAFEAAIEEAL